MMEHENPLLIVVDAGHGGEDYGATFEGRMEKDDNLRLALETQKAFKRCGIEVLMTRTDDYFVTLEDRVDLANNANADLFISLHRNSYFEQTPDSNGVENFIYLTAPEQSTGRAAALVLEEVVKVGVQNDRGVTRGNYYVLRRSAMPAMLLEMGFIINELDNKLFDEKLTLYAKAIVRGTMRHFGLDPERCKPGKPCKPETNTPPDNPTKPTREARPAIEAASGEGYGISAPSGGISRKPTIYEAERDPAEHPVHVHTAPLSPPAAVAPATPKTPAIFSSESDPSAKESLNGFSSKRIAAAQSALNNRYNCGLEISGQYGSETRSAVITALQIEINRTYGKNLEVSGVICRNTQAAIPVISPGSPAPFIYLLQILLVLGGYDIDAIDGIYGFKTRMAVQLCQRDHYFIPNGTVEPGMILTLLDK